uniref:G-protein coupled receptors family 1 profile domain-containing protein n=1 Tax=Eptatretus burgeri TaxID=7764 RepID=A0A8C4R6S5_EPTBU
IPTWSNLSGKFTLDDFSPTCIAMNITTEEYSIPEPYYTSLILFFASLSAFTILGNTLVLAAVIHSHHLMHGVTHVYICSLSVADILIGILVMPSTTMKVLHGPSIYGRDVCNFLNAVDIACVTVSITTLCAIAIDRYIAVTRPLQYRTVVTWTRACGVVVLLWSLSISISFLPIFLGWNQSTFPEHQLCYDDPECCNSFFSKEYLLTITIIPFYTPSIIMILGVLNMQSNGRSKYCKENQNKGMNTSEHQALKTLSVVMGIFLFCWFPFHIISSLQIFCPTCTRYILFDIFLLLGYLNSACNPVLYSRSPELMAAYKRLLRLDGRNERVGNRNMMTRIKRTLLCKNIHSEKECRVTVINKEGN